MVNTAESSTDAAAAAAAGTADGAAGGSGKARIALIGTGGRSEMYIRAIYGNYAGTAELVAFSDVNPGRVEFYQQLIQELGAPGPVASFDPAQLTAFIQANNIDRVIVTTPDYTHADYIVEGLRSGADVVVEKPLTIDAEGCRRITQAVQETGRNVVVTFNYRYSPRNSALKEIIQSGVIGKVTSIDFSWVLDTVHGADYFRRWHREKKNSGGLLIHKASHHFDLVNWWIDDVPERVFASGGLKFYGDKNAAERGLGPRPERGTPDAEAPAREKDPFALDLREDERLKALFLDNEHYDGYRRDQDVFTGGITIEDNLALVVEYQGGPRLSYSLNAHSPWEGYRVAVNGTEGRAELEVVERAAVLHSTDKKTVVDPSATPVEEEDAVRRNGERLVVQRHWEAAYEVPIINGEGGHGGGDELLLSDLFNGPGDDPLGRPSGYLDGLRSVSVGIAGNRSLESSLPVRIEDLDLGADLRRSN
ncbi:gfo/Idh/MocA family oxidoreductase [Pseudarthrobacter phenanthrenivorans]|uniref:Gfo/Idh/MocA family oxidoreductase n=1 Tax=Pseudarthrobacter phenanthrenivorans TaxID=361575 RepID=A0A3B0FL15_PSEPS|nr:Gfo/Idh/MocA family oxidoreductase [Pseudarthrobacter phenanthrenivorans]RKO20589.1 gfo/Idh/MocA family oxidoreductase [Pseudarthrobacter phenanthrenivorans]TPV52382.1 Gfo/Idh/MocA family oxidoreductase [Pseudarthrobacter phenanthrenivorans]